MMQPGMMMPGMMAGMPPGMMGGMMQPGMMQAGMMGGMAGQAAGGGAAAFGLSNGGMTQHTRHARRIYVGGCENVTDNDVQVFFADSVRTALGEAPETPPHVVSVYLNAERAFAFIEFDGIELTSAAMSKSERGSRERERAERGREERERERERDAGEGRKMRLETREANDYSVDPNVGV